MTSPCIGVCKLDPSIGRCLTLTIRGKGGYAVTMRPENRLQTCCRSSGHFPQIQGTLGQSQATRQTHAYDTQTYDKRRKKSESKVK